MDLGMLDVQQVFGRAGRPQFDTRGEATIITSHDKLAHYLSMLTHSTPIESQFVKNLVDNLNAGAEPCHAAARACVPTKRTICCGVKLK